MKLLKPVSIVLGALVGLGVLLVVVGLIPAVQTWAARKAVADLPGLEISLGQVAVGFSRAKLGNVMVTQDGATVSAGSIEVEYSVWDYLTSGKANVSRLTVAGVEIDLRQTVSGEPMSFTSARGQTLSSGAKPPADKGPSPVAAPFNGLLKVAQLPVDLTLAVFSVRGKALLPEGRGVTFDVQGSDIAPGRTGAVKWAIHYEDSLDGTAVQSVRNEGTLEIRLTPDRKIEQIEIDTITSLIGPKLPSDRVRAQVTAEATGGRETYWATIALLRGSRAPAPPETLLSSKAVFDPATQSIDGSWELATRSDQLGAILAGLGLPDLDLSGKGQFSFAPATTAASVRGEIRAKIARLEAISPELAVIGAVQLNTSFEGGMKGDVVSLTGLSLDATDSNNLKFAEVRLLQSLGFSLADQRVDVADAKLALARVALNEVPLAWGQPWLTDQRLESGTLSMALTVAADAEGENISVLTAEPLRLKGVTVAQGDQKLFERLELSVNPKINYTAERVTAELADLSITLPAGDAVTGRVSVEVTELMTTPTITFATKLNAKIVKVLQPFLPLDPGPVTIRAELQGGLNNNALLRLSGASVQVERTAGDILVTAIDLGQPLQVDLESMAMTTDQPEKPMVRIKLGTLPLTWAEAFVADAKLSGSVTGGVLDVSMKAGDDLTLTTVEPLTLRGVSVTLADQPQVKDLDLSVDFSAGLKGESVTYDVHRLNVTGGGSRELATLIVTGGMGIGEAFTLGAKGKLDADVAALAKQPALASLIVVEQGRVAATFDATFRATGVDAKVTATLRNFVTILEKTKLADVDLALTATVGANGHGRIELPLTVVAGKNRSDVLVKGTFELPPAAVDGTTDKGATGPIRFDGAITSARLVIDDLQAFSALLPAAPEPAKPVVVAPTRTISDRLSAAASATIKVPAGTPPPARDAAPIWQGLVGSVVLNLKEVHYGEEVVINQVNGTGRISSTEIAIDGLEASMNQNPLKVNGGITFDSKAIKPYQLTGTVDVKGVAVGPFLQPSNRQQRPPLEGIVGVNADVKGDGGTLAELIKNSYGVFEFNGTGGVLRMLGQRGETIGRVSSLLGLVGALSGSESTMAASELASSFNELKFDQFKIRVERGADLNIKFSTIEFVSPTLRLSGSGNLIAQKDTNLEDQPMHIVLAMGGKGRMAQLLDKAGLLSGETDAQGYSLLQQTFSIRGTPTNPDANAFWRLVSEAGIRAAAGFRGK